MTDVADAPVQTASAPSQGLPPWFDQAQSQSRARWMQGHVDLSALRLLRIDESELGYQRPLSDARVQHLISAFDASEAREIYVSRRSDGSMYILDGQHTWAALREMGYTHWFGRVFFDLTPEEEARRFAEYQSNSRPIPAVVRWNAEVISGNEDANAIEAILASFYLRISTSKLRARDGYLGIGSRSVPEKVYRLGGANLLREVLQLCTDAWGQNKNAYLGRVMQAVSFVLANVDAPLDRDRMVDVLRNTTGPNIVQAIGAGGGGGAVGRGAGIVLDLYRDGSPPHWAKLAKKEVPKLREKGGEVNEVFWSEDTADKGRSAVSPVAPPKTVSAAGAEAVAEAPEAFQAAPIQDNEDFSYPAEAVQASVAE